jgi:hypothetical protein
MLPLHELIHLVFMLRCGISSETTVGFWLVLRSPCIYNAGEVSRQRYLIACAGPLVILSILPLLLSIPMHSVVPWIFVVSMLNAFVASGDILNMFLLLRSVPRGAILRHWGWETYWTLRPA